MKINHATERIIRALLREKGNKMDVWELSRECGYLLDVISAAESLKKEGVAAIKNSTVYLKNKNKLPSYVLKKEKPIGEIMRKYNKIKQEVSFDNIQYDQLSLLPGAIENKLSVMIKRGDLLNRDILCLGDDDLFSIAVSLTGLPKSVTVFDIDEKIIGFIKRVSSNLPVPIKTVSLNLLNPLPKKYCGAFDVFVTEPPDTVKGNLFFVSHGIQSLREGGVFYLGMTEMTLKRKQWLEVEKAIVQSNIVFTDIIRDHEEYVLEKNNSELTWKGFEKLPPWINKPPNKPWFVSTLFRGEIAGNKKKIRLSLKNIEKELITSLLP